MPLAVRYWGARGQERSQARVGFRLAWQQVRMEEMRIASYFTLVALAAFAAQSPAASLSFAEQTKLMGAAQQVVDATRRGDATTVAAHTSHLITRLGISVESIPRMTRAVVAETDAMGMSIDSEDVGRPSALYMTTDAEVCFIPYRLNIHMPGHKGRSIGFLIAVREHPKVEWEFLDGSILHSHPEELKTLLPGLPDGIELPEVRNEFDD